MRRDWVETTYSALLTEFKKLSPKERVANAGVFHRRLETLVASPEERRKVWDDEFTPLLSAMEAGESRQRIEASEVNDFDTAHGQALSHKKSARTDEALVWHERAVDLAKTTRQRTMALGSWAATLRGLRRFEQAHELLRRSIAADSSRQTNRHGYTSLIATLTDLGHLRQAVAEADSLLKVHPDDHYVLSAAGRAYVALAEKTKDSSMREHGVACLARGDR